MINLGHTKQAGQVMAEAVVMLALLVTFLYALQHVGAQLFQWHQWSNTVHQQALNQSVFIAVQNPLGLEVVKGVRDPTHGVMQAQWGLGHSHWVKAKAEHPFKHHTTFLSGVGATANHIETSQRLPLNILAWQRQALSSQAQVGLLMPGLTAIDLPWWRAKPSIDWISEWSDSSPKTLQNNTILTRKSLFNSTIKAIK